MNLQIWQIFSNFAEVFERLRVKSRKSIKWKVAELRLIQVAALSLIFQEKNTMETTPNERLILGIDPGSNVMGYSILRVVGRKAECVTLGVIDMRKIHDQYLSLQQIFVGVSQVIAQYLPDELAIEAPFFGKNVQSMLKLGRAQGVAIAAAITHDIPVAEYAPLKIKQAITGNGAASKEQVAGMLCRLLKLDAESLPKQLDATDALGAAYCHFLETSRPTTDGKHYRSWKDFLAKNPDKVK
jgi:crossover junction endodeoxyribonuclease RuvC